MRPLGRRLAVGNAGWRRSRGGVMRFSPFRARLVLLGFFAIASGIGANLLAFQQSDDPATDGLRRSENSVLAQAKSHLDRLIGEVVEAEAAGNRNERQKASLDTVDGPPAQSGPRTGRFAPSAGAFSASAIPGGNAAEARRATVRAVQTELSRRGYEPGAADGATGLITRAAVLAYEFDQGLPLTAEPSPEVLAHLRHGTSAPGAAIGLDGEPTPPRGQAETVIRAVQQSLKSLGYLAVAANGEMGEETVRAIREFEMDAGLVPTGRISAPLVARLTKQADERKRG